MFESTYRKQLVRNLLINHVENEVKQTHRILGILLYEISHYSLKQPFPSKEMAIHFILYTNPRVEHSGQY